VNLLLEHFFVQDTFKNYFLNAIQYKDEKMKNELSFFQFHIETI